MQTQSKTIKVDIRDLEGNPLDWLVMLCLTTKVPLEKLTGFTDGMVLGPQALVNFAPSTVDKDAQWIIEKYGIHVSHHPSSPSSGWQDYSAIRGEHHLIGHNKNTAAMRCFVASFMGINIDFPSDVWESLDAATNPIHDDIRSPVQEPSCEGLQQNEFSGFVTPIYLLPVLIPTTGNYLTRSGEVVNISAILSRRYFGCIGTYQNGTRESWHRSGRILESRETSNDIIGQATDSQTTEQTLD